MPKIVTRSINFDDLAYAKLDEIPRLLNDIRNSLPVSATNPRISINAYETCGSASYEVMVEFERLETEKEEAARDASEKRNRDYRKERYERLKKEFVE